MTRAFRNAVLTLTALLLVSGAVFGQAQGRVQGTVVDENGDPIQGVKVTVTAESFAFEDVKTTDKKGRFAILFVDATRVYDFIFEKEGYVKVKQPLKPAIGDNMRQEFVVPTLEAQGSTQTGSGDAGAGSSRNPAINTFNDGVTAFQEGDLTTAKAKFLKATEQDGKFVEAYSALAGLYMDEDSSDEALAMATKVLELEPGNARALRVQYDVYREQGKQAEADAVLEMLKSADGGTDTAVRIFNEGAEAARLGDLDAAQARFEEAVELDPELAAGHNALARVYFLQEEFEKSIAAADLAMEIDPGMAASVLKFKYESHRGLGQDDQALEVFQQMSAEDPEGTARAIFDQGEAMYNGGNIAGATTAFEQVLAADPSYLRAHYYLGLCYVNSGETAKAKEHLQKFIDEAGDDPEVTTAKEMLSYLG